MIWDWNRCALVNYPERTLCPFAVMRLRNEWKRAVVKRSVTTEGDDFESCGHASHCEVWEAGYQSDYPLCA